MHKAKVITEPSEIEIEMTFRFSLSQWLLVKDHVSGYQLSRPAIEIFQAIRDMSERFRQTIYVEEGEQP